MTCSSTKRLRIKKVDWKYLFTENTKYKKTWKGEKATSSKWKCQKTLRWKADVLDNITKMPFHAMTIAVGQ